MKKKLMRFYWIVVMIFFTMPRSLKQFKIFCLKIDGMSKQDWDEQEELIRLSPTMKAYFGIK